MSYHHILPTLLLLSACASSDPDPIFADGGFIGDFQTLPDAARCLPNNDGVISQQEAPFLIGLPVSYRVNPPGTLVPVDVAGTQEEGKHRWDFSATARSQLFSLAVESPANQWFSPLFPNAQFAVPTTPTGDVLQLLRLDGDRVLLLGLASRKKDYTRLVYDTPVLLLRFPLKVGDSYESSAASSNGMLEGLPIATRDVYRVSVDAEGTVVLPALTLRRSLRIRSTVTSQALGGATAVVRQVQFFHECYGEVARMVSQKDEASDDFAQAVEYRRISF